MKLLFTLIAVLLLSIVAVRADRFDEVHRSTEIDNLKLTIDRMGILIKRIEPPRIDANTSHHSNSYCSWGGCVLGFNNNRQVDLVVCCASPVLRCLFKDRNPTTPPDLRNRIVAGGLLGKKYRYCHSGDYASEDHRIGGVIGPVNTTNASGAGEMATYLELRALFEDSDLLNRISTAVAIACDTIIEGNDTVNPPWEGGKHGTRVKWADNALSNVRETAEDLFRLFLGKHKALAVAAIQNKTDAAIQSDIELFIDELAEAQFGGTPAP